MHVRHSLLFYKKKHFMIWLNLQREKLDFDKTSTLPGIIYSYVYTEIYSYQPKIEKKARNQWEISKNRIYVRTLTQLKEIPSISRIYWRLLHSRSISSTNLNIKNRCEGMYTHKWATPPTQTPSQISLKIHWRRDVTYIVTPDVILLLFCRVR